MTKNRCLLITGTVIPNSNYVSITNVDERLKEYYEALKYYSENFKNEPIYFLENSNYDFSTNDLFSKLFQDGKITLVKFPVSDNYNEGKGFQEFEMIDKAVESLIDKHHSFIKITGRYIVRNLNYAVDKVISGLIIEQHKKKKIAMTNVFCSTFDFYKKHLKGAFREANDSKGIIIEQIVYGKISPPHINTQTRLFKRNLQIEGVSGSYGLPIKRNRLKMLLRGLERQLLRLANINEFLIEY